MLTETSGFEGMALIRVSSTGEAKCRGSTIKCGRSLLARSQIGGIDNWMQVMATAFCETPSLPELSPTV